MACFAALGLDNNALRDLLPGFYLNNALRDLLPVPSTLNCYLTTPAVLLLLGRAERLKRPDDGL